MLTETAPLLKPTWMAPEGMITLVTFRFYSNRE
jgi:hypothetical protein